MIKKIKNYLKVKKLVRSTLKAQQFEIDYINQLFGLTYASWIVLPRVLMEQMPAEWQKVFKDLWDEFYDEWNMDLIYRHGEPHVQLRKGGRFVSIEKTGLPHYRHPGNLDMFRNKK